MVAHSNCVSRPFRKRLSQCSSPVKNGALYCSNIGTFLCSPMQYGLIMHHGQDDIRKSPLDMLRGPKLSSFFTNFIHLETHPCGLGQKRPRWRFAPNLRSNDSTPELPSQYRHRRDRKWQPSSKILKLIQLVLHFQDLCYFLAGQIVAQVAT